MKRLAIFLVLLCVSASAQATLFVDPLYTGGGNNGSSTNPYTSIANAMSTANTDLTAGTSVTIYISACDPTCSTEESIDGFSSSQRTSTGSGAASTAVLTIDGMSKYQTNPTHSTAGGATWATHFVPPSPPSFPGENYAKTLLDSTSGLVNASGTAITWQSSGLQDEPQFNTQWSSRAITINSVGYTISSCSSVTSCTLTSSAGTQTGVAYTVASILKAQMTGSVPLGSTDSFSNCKGYIVYHGLDVANNNGQTADLTYIHDMTLEYSELHRIGVGSGGPGVYIGPGQHGPCHTGATRPSGTDSGPDNVTVQYNHIHETWGECIYDGANSSDPFVANAACTACQQFESGTSGDNLAGGNGCASNSLVCGTPGTPATGATGANHVIKGNTIESCAAWGGQEDGTDLKDGHTNLQVLGNTYAPSMTPPCMTASTPCTSLQCKGGNNAGTACTSNATCTGTGGYCGTGNQGGRGIVAESCTRISGNFVRLSTVDAIDVVDSWNTSTGRTACQVDNNIVTNINSGIGHNNGVELEALNVTGLAQWGNISFLSDTVYSAGNYSTNTATCMTTSPGALSGTLLAEDNTLSACGNAVTFGTGTHDYNDFFNPTTTPSGEGAHSITGNPTFANATPVLDTDFELQGTSPLLSAGVNLSSTFTTDYFGDTRSVPFSIGAYQPAPPSDSATLIGSCNNLSSPTTNCTISATGATIGDTALVVLETSPFTVTALSPTISGSLCWPVRLWDVDMTQGASGIYLFSWICPSLTSTTPSIVVNATNTITTVNFAAVALDLGGLGTNPQPCGAPSTWPSYGLGGGNFASGSSTTPTVSLTDSAGCLQIAFGGQVQNGSATNCTPGAGFTLDTAIHGTSSALLCVQHNLSSAGGTNSVSMTMNGTDAWGFQAISLQSGSTPYNANLPPQSNGYFIQKSAITNQGCSTGTSGTCAFPSLVTAPGGNVVMVFRAVPSGGQGSGGNSAPAVMICNTSCQSANGASGWAAYSGTTYGTQCSGIPNGFVYSGDCGNTDLIWAPSGLFVYNSTIYMTVSVLNSSLSACQGAYIGTGNSNGTNFNALTLISATACWGGQLIYIPSGQCGTYPSGVLIAPIDDNTLGVQWWASTDGGNTWSTLTTNAGFLFNTTENSTYWTGGCNLIGISRAAAGQPYRWYATSNFGTTFTNGSTNIVTTGNPANDWEMTNPVIINPNKGDGRLSVLTWDRNVGQFRVINFLPSALTQGGSAGAIIGNGQPIVLSTGANTQGYGTATQLSNGSWMFAWFDVNGVNGNGALFTMVGTYVPSTVAPSPQMFAEMTHSFKSSPRSVREISSISH